MRLSALLSLLASLAFALAFSPELEQDVTQLFNSTAGGSGQHTNNWAILVCASRYWFNYRHMANTLAMYRTIKRLGIPDSNILLMLADDVSCNARNPFPAQVYANKDRRLDLYGDGIEVDYRGYEVTVESFLRLLTGRQPAHTPPSKRLLTDASSNVFIYMTGHGGNEFLKFQDNEEVSAFDIADAIEQMSEKRRFNKLLFVIDTCQANTMYSKFYSPEVISTGSSEIGENSYSHHNDLDIGVAVIDSYTHHILQYLETLTKTSKATLKHLFDDYNPVLIHSHPGISTELSASKPEEILVTDFFGGVANVEFTPAEQGLMGPARKPVKWESADPAIVEARQGVHQLPDHSYASTAEAGVVRRFIKPVRPSEGVQGWLRPLEGNGKASNLYEMAVGVCGVALVGVLLAWTILRRLSSEGAEVRGKEE